MKAAKVSKDDDKKSVVSRAGLVFAIEKERSGQLCIHMKIRLIFDWKILPNTGYATRPDWQARKTECHKAVD